MPQWIAREYLARRGAAHFRPEQLWAARCPLLGYTLRSIQVEGAPIGPWFLQVETQPDVGEAAYDAGAAQLTRFFHEQLALFDDPELDPVGRSIIDACLSGATVEDYAQITAPS